MIPRFSGLPGLYLYFFRGFVLKIKYDDDDNDDDGALSDCEEYVAQYDLRGVPVHSPAFSDTKCAYPLR